MGGKGGKRRGNMGEKETGGMPSGNSNIFSCV